MGEFHHLQGSSSELESRSVGIIILEILASSELEIVNQSFQHIWNIIELLQEYIDEVTWKLLNLILGRG